MCGFLTAISTKEIDENKFSEISLLSKHIEHRGPDDFFTTEILVLYHFSID